MKTSVVQMVSLNFSSAASQVVMADPLTPDSTVHLLQALSGG